MSEAAQNYALKARAIYDQLSGEPPATIAVTRVRENSNSDCRYYVGINNVLSPDKFTNARKRYLNQARNDVGKASDAVLNQFPLTVFGVIGGLRRGNGPDGHAEYNLYTELEKKGVSVIAIGVSQPPCGNCSNYFQPLGVELRYAR